MEYKTVVKRTSECNDSAMIHSDSFLGDEFSDELYHWKYIKKEKMPSGKVKYYYKKSPIEKFKWGYELGSKEDPNTGRTLNRDNIDPAVYRKLANSYVDYYHNLNDPFYRGRETSEILKEMDHVAELAKENETKVHMAKSFMGKLGQFVGRSVNDVEYSINKGKSKIEKLFNKLK